MQTRLARLAGVALVLALQPTVALPGPNADITLPLHALIGPAGCDVPDPCDPGPPLVEVPPGELVTIYLLMRHFDNVAGVQTAFEWGDWVYHGADWMCLGHQVTGTVPSGSGGPIAGTIATAFDCVIGPATTVVGVMVFTTGQSGCFTQVESGFPFGTHVVSCGNEVDPIGPAHRGAICVGTGGVNACNELPPTPPVCDTGGPYHWPVGFPLEFDGTGSFDPDGHIVSYAWEFGDGSTGTGPTHTHTYGSAGVYDVTLCVTDNDAAESCCGTTATLSKENFPPSCAHGGPYAGPPEQVVIFDGTGSIDIDGTIVSYSWEFGDGATGGGPISSHVYATGGLFTVTLSVTDDENAQSSCETRASIAELPPPGTVDTGLVLHAIETGFGPCEPPVPACPDPVTSVDVGDVVAVYLVVDYFEEMAAVQTAFDFGPFEFQFGLWDCQTNQVGGTTPVHPGGPTAGTLATAFDCVTGPGNAVIGRLHFIAQGIGCVTQPQSSFPFGNHIVSCGGEVTPITAPSCLGSVCAGVAGINACGPCLVTSVETTTWGAIKARYRQ